MAFPQHPPTHGFGQQPPTPPPRSNSRLILAIIAGLAVLIVIVVAVLLFMGGNNKGSTNTAQSGSSSTSDGASGSTSSTTTTKASSTTTGSPTSTTSGGSASEPRVTIDGKEQKVDGSVRCSQTLGVTINIGTTAIVNLSTTDPPEVRSVNIHGDDGVLTYQNFIGGGDATATKSGNTYKITGHANQLSTSGVQSRAFEIDVTCP